VIDVPFDLVAFAEATPGTGTVYVAAGLGDSLYRATLDDIIVHPQGTKLLGLWANAVSVPAGTLIRQPQMVDYHFDKVCLGVTLEQFGYTHLFGRPLPLRGADKMNALTINAADEAALIGVWLGSSKITKAMLDSVNPTHLIHGAITQTCTVRTWTQGTVTWVESLPAGEYAIVGMRAGTYKSSGPGPALMRILIPYKTDWRPGVVCDQLVGASINHTCSEDYPMGDWPLMPEVTIDPNLGMPNVEIFSAVANTHHSVELLLQKIK
jgi:hypothetical protein